MTFKDLVGCKIISISGVLIGSDAVVFQLDDGRKFKLYHSQCCCEYVRLAEIHGDINDIIDSDIVYAIESSNSDDRPSDSSGSFTWTFYRLMTNKGSLVLRWLGESNGYYSESVEFSEVVSEIANKSRIGETGKHIRLKI